MVLQVSQLNDVKVYNVTSSKSIPEWLERKRKQSLRYDLEHRSRVDFIQDLEFPEASNRLKMTPDGKNLLVTGVYKPQVRAFEMVELGMKFERHMNCEVVQFQILSEDWTKLAFLQMDRTLEFHSNAGTYYKTRVPRYGRDLAYHAASCDLITVGVGSEAWRLNLDLGRFMNPFQTTLPSINICKVNPVHNLLAFGSEDGKVEFWDPRARNAVGKLDVGSHIVKTFSDVESIPEVSAFRYDSDGLTFAVGSSSGHVLLFDLRKDSPFQSKDHQYQYPIKDIKFHASGNVISSDTKIIKVWDKTTADTFTTIEPPHDINDVCVFENSGLMIAACENPKLQAFYVPQLGSAPKWCSYLDSLTEELEENPQPTIYDDYKFVTKKELENLGLDHLYGTNLLRAYMHGFFIDVRLYEKAKAISNPFEYEDFMKKTLQERIEKERGSRISIQKKKLPSVNQMVAKKLLAEKKGDVDGENPLGDDRFGAMFKDPKFEVDENSEEFKLMYPQKRLQALEESFKKINEDPYAGEKEGRDSDDSSDDSDDDLMMHLHRKRGKGRVDEEESEEEDDDDDENGFDKDTQSRSKQKGAGPKFYEIKQGHSLKSLTKGGEDPSAKKRGKSFADRLRTENHSMNTSRTAYGNMELKYIPKQGDGFKKVTKAPRQHEIRDRRGVKDLKLKRLPGSGGPQKKRR